MKRRILAHQVADQLFAAEAAIDGALSAVAQLTAMLPNVRIDAGLSAVVGQNVIDRSSQTIAALADARRGIVETHRELTEVQHQIGLGAIALGGVDKPKPTARGEIGADVETLPLIVGRNRRAA